MVNLGNAWHIPTNPQPRGRGGMRDPIGALVPGMAITIFSGNQDQGPGGSPGNQLQVGSSVFFKRTTDAAWTEAPMLFWSAADNDKFYAATLAADTFAAGDVVQYYLRIPYSDHDTTFQLANGPVSATTADETAARGAPFTFTVESAAVRGQWGPVFPLPNGLVLMWGRREPGNPDLDVQACVVTPVPRVLLFITLAGPAPSGDADTSRRCQGCSHPPRHLPGRAALSFTVPAATGPAAKVSHLHSNHQRLAAHTSSDTARRRRRASRIGDRWIA